MKFNMKAFAITLSALLLMLAPAMAGARTIYFLVGVRHVYRIGPDRDLFIQQREEIEKTYADGVAADEATYQQHVDGGADPVAEAQARDGDLALLADDRDKSLGALFDLRDDIRDRHPELQIQGDGPYQVMGIDYHVNDNVMVFDDFTVYAPWPGYVVVGAPYGGWVYDRPYQPGIFFNLYLGWHRSYVAVGAPVFYGGFCGHGGYVPFHAGVFVGGPAVYRSYAPPGGVYFSTAVRTGVYHPSAGGRLYRPAPAGFHPGPGVTPGGFNPNRVANPGGFNRPNNGSSSSGWNRSTSGSRTATGGYSHGGGAPGRSFGQPSGSRSSGQPSGSVTRSNSGGYSHSGGTRGNGPGSFNSTSGANRDNGTRSGGFGGTPTTGSSRSAGTGSRSSGYSHGVRSSSGRSSSGGGHGHSDDKRGH